METIEQKLLTFLTDNGLWPAEAKAVLEAARPQIERSGRITWHRPADEYPVPFYAVMFLILRRVALEWIDANKPLHFARPMFMPNPAAEIARLQQEVS